MSEPAGDTSADVADKAIQAAQARLGELLGDVAPASALALYTMAADVLAAALPHQRQADRDRLVADTADDVFAATAQTVIEATADLDRLKAVANGRAEHG